MSTVALQGKRVGSITLRPYQREAIEAIFQKWLEFDRLLLIQPTGGGKTLQFAHVAKRRAAAGPVLIITHLEQLVTQAVEKIALAVGIEADKEKAESYASLAASVVVGSVQTLSLRAVWNDSLPIISLLSYLMRPTIVCLNHISESSDTFQMRRCSALPLPRTAETLEISASFSKRLPTRFRSLS